VTSWKLTEDSDGFIIETDCGDPVVVLSFKPTSAALGLCSQTRLKNHQYNRRLRSLANLIVATPKLLEACKLAAKTFRHYEELHLAKETDAGFLKAKENRNLAYKMEQAISEATAEPKE
jgi:hypothetical protein